MPQIWTMYNIMLYTRLDMLIFVCSLNIKQSGLFLWNLGPIWVTGSDGPGLSCQCSGKAQDKA